MTVRLHGEYGAVVARTTAWGVVVTTLDGDEIFVDNTKVGAAAPGIGSAVRVVVLDDLRSPPRGSLLALDCEIAGHLRTREQ